MQPSTQVTQMPEPGVTEPSALFFVSVAADVFILEKVIVAFLLFPSYSFSISQATQGSM